MRNRRADAVLSITFLLVSFLFIILGVIWLLNGFSNDNSSQVLYGSLSLGVGLVIAGIANFL
ncbi:MAG: hypothetical protein IH934_03310 [Nanoarchaeota archaeon]|nr:hypothetical protein [Nanoarchaeota archaeon]